ncbi:hypothetical protein NMY22_g17885 [Coprinellus aureogranulatus]|nr:hypothetical protein NMY22_g17885 [Coprinellus aureogranulatus]
MSPTSPLRCTLPKDIGDVHGEEHSPNGCQGRSLWKPKRSSISRDVGEELPHKECRRRPLGVALSQGMSAPSMEQSTLPKEVCDVHREDPFHKGCRRRPRRGALSERISAMSLESCSPPKDVGDVLCASRPSLERRSFPRDLGDAHSEKFPHKGCQRRPLRRALSQRISLTPMEKITLQWVSGTFFGQSPSLKRGADILCERAPRRRPMRGVQNSPKGCWRHHWRSAHSRRMQLASLENSPLARDVGDVPCATPSLETAPSQRTSATSIKRCTLI